jgi:hypothetical protein
VSCLHVWPFIGDTRTAHPHVPITRVSSR